MFPTLSDIPNAPTRLSNTHPSSLSFIPNAPTATEFQPPTEDESFDRSLEFPGEPRFWPPESADSNEELVPMTEDLIIADNLRPSIIFPSRDDHQVRKHIHIFSFYCTVHSFLAATERRLSGKTTARHVTQRTVCWKQNRIGHWKQHLSWRCSCSVTGGALPTEISSLSSNMRDVAAREEIHSTILSNHRPLPGDSSSSLNKGEAHIPQFGHSEGRIVMDKPSTAPSAKGGSPKHTMKVEATQSDKGNTLLTPSSFLHTPDTPPIHSFTAPNTTDTDAANPPSSHHASTPNAPAPSASDLHTRHCTLQRTLAASSSRGLATICELLLFSLILVQSSTSLTLSESAAYSACAVTLSLTEVPASSTRTDPAQPGEPATPPAARQ